MTASPPAVAALPGLCALPPRVVEFHGARGGQAGLTWGQQGIWRSTQRVSREGRLTVRVYEAAAKPMGEAKALDTPGAVHAAVMRAAAGRTDVLAPHHYVLCAAPPADAADGPGCPRLAEGDGREPFPATNHMER